MKVRVQHLQTRLFLQSDRSWAGLDDRPMVFPDAVAAISFCIRHGTREVRLIGTSADGHETCIYPFGQDPAVRLERKKLRKLVAKNRELRRQRSMLLARLDLLSAESKERKKQFPFQRKTIGNDQAPLGMDAA